MDIMPDTVRKYGTASPVLMLARDSHDPYDEFGWVQGWRFALRDYLTHEWGERPEGFRSAPSGPDEDAWEYEALMEARTPPGDARYALTILNRYREWLRMAGRDY